MSFYPCFFLISVALFGAVTCIDNNSRVLVHATECTAHGETTQRCRFNSRGLQLQTSSTIEFVAHNGNTVKCGKKNVVGDNVWYGECEGDARDANFVQRTDDNGDALVFGSIHIGTDICHISPNADGIDEISCTPISDFPEEEESVLAPPHDEDDYLNRDRTRSLEFLNDPTAIMSDNMHRDLQDNSTAVIDVMVVWTKQAECKVSGLLDISSCTLTTVTENNMLGLIDLAVTETNTALQLSGIYSTLRLVHAYRDLTYVEPTSNVYPVALEELRNLTDGKLDSVHKKRTLYGADLVQLFMSSTVSCGIGYVNTGKSYAFSVIQAACATGVYSYGHELGHNFNMNHDRGTEGKCNTTGTGSNYGFRTPDASFRSILASNCKTNVCGNMTKKDCTRAQRFSNTFSNYLGQPMGDAFNDNAKQWNSIRKTIASHVLAINCKSNAGCKDNDNSTIDICNIAKGTCVFTPYVPTAAPTRNPTNAPITFSPSAVPTNNPSLAPSSVPSSAPTGIPSIVPSSKPSSSPSSTPTDVPSIVPSSVPSSSPSSAPTDVPSIVPSSTPSSSPSSDPTNVLSIVPSSAPSSTPTDVSSSVPSSVPSSAPTGSPITFPSTTPSVMPSKSPVKSLPVPRDIAASFIESKKIDHVTSFSWTVVLLLNTYISPIPVCTVQYDTGTTLIPAVVRMKNVTGTSFQIRLQNPSNQKVTDREVHCVIAEEGAYRLIDGRRIEAKKYRSHKTDHDRSWFGQKQIFMNNYTSPVVLGQVMTFTDSRWSVFYARSSGNYYSAPNRKDFRAGKHVGEDTPIRRLAETVGYIVIESGHSTYDTVEMECGRTSEAVVGYVEKKYTQPFRKPFKSTPAVTVVSQVGMNDREGSWAVVTGDATSTYFGVAVDEDQTFDMERVHRPEEVDYIAFSTIGAIQTFKL